MRVSTAPVWNPAPGLFDGSLATVSQRLDSAQLPRLPSCCNLPGLWVST